MPSSPTDESSSSPPALTLSGGGYVIVLAMIPVIAVLCWAAAGVLSRGDHGGQVPLQDVEDYGFDLSTFTGAREHLAPGAESRNYITPLDSPAMITPQQADAITREERGKYLVSTDRIIGVSINGESRAYPLRMLDWHEVVNDEAGGVPIVVSYCGLADSAAVFERRIGGETLQFASSGLVYQSNHVLYDRRDGADGEAEESLWAPLHAEAIAGPAAERGERLSLVPCELVTWNDWRTRHPETLVLAPNPDPAREKYYKRRTYGSYHSSDEIRFPVAPLPRDGRALKTPMIVIFIEDDEPHAFAIDELIAQADAGVATIRVGDDRVIQVHVTASPPTARAVEQGQVLPVMYAFHFAWHAAAAETWQPQD